jgi:transmembrane sensor
MALIKRYKNMDWDILLAKYASGEAAPEERLKVEEWVSVAEINKKQLQDIRFILLQSNLLPRPAPADEQLAWQRFRKRMENKTAAAVPAKSLYHQMRWIQVAAVFIMVAGIAVFFFNKQSHNEIPAASLSIFSGNISRTDTLPDGSVVTLNKNSSLHYPAQFTGSQRNIQLQGDAFFSVVHDGHKPFIISVNDITVTVAGTSFAIHSTLKKTEVSVRTGIVRVTRNHDQLTLVAGDSIAILQSDTMLIKQTDTAHENKHRTGGRDTLVKHVQTALPDNPVKQKEIMRSIISELVEAHLVRDQNTLVWLALNDTVLFINGEKQTAVIHKKFKEKYLQTPGIGFYYGPAKIVGKGFFFTKEELEKQY